MGPVANAATIGNSFSWRAGICQQPVLIEELNPGIEAFGTSRQGRRLANRVERRGEEGRAKNNRLDETYTRDSATEERSLEDLLVEGISKSFEAELRQP